MKQQIYEEALKRILMRAAGRERDGAPLPSVLLEQIEKLAQEALQK